MKTSTKLFFWATTILLLANITVLNVSAVAAAEVTEITLDPPIPYPQDTITFSTIIKGNKISEVRLIIQECNRSRGVCYPRMNVSMTMAQSDTYEAEITLAYADATYITYNVEVKDDAGWMTSTITELDLDVTSPPPNNNGSTNGNGNDTPGFEAITFLIGVCVTLILVLHSRKRSR